MTWITRAPAQALLQNNPLIDRILTLDADGLLALEAVEFDAVFCTDKSLTAGGLVARARTQKVFGFHVDPATHSIIPANPEAEELWQLGLSDQKKFFENQKPETQLLVEAMALKPFVRDPYVLRLTSEEINLAEHRRLAWKQTAEVVIGVNTGSSDVIPYKRLSTAYQRRLVKELIELPGVRVVLLGGPTDRERNLAIASGLPEVILSPTDLGIRDGLCSVAACDVMITGDSLGMHMGIALKKWVIAWFGPTCAQEIDLYDRGRKIQTLAGCSPCWKRNCNRSPMCYDLVPFDDLMAAVEEGIRCINSSYKPHLLATSYSPSL